MKWNDPSDYDEVDRNIAIVSVYVATAFILLLAIVAAACVVLAALWLWLPAR
jgi:hypothetical protein